MLSPFECLCGNFILPEPASYVFLLCCFQFAQLIVHYHYMVFYRVQGNDVYIDRVLYGRSDYMSVLFKDLLREETTE